MDEEVIIIGEINLSLKKSQDVYGYFDDPQNSNHILVNHWQTKQKSSKTSQSSNQSVKQLPKLISERQDNNLKVNKQKKIKKSDFKKNICGYITKSIINIYLSGKDYEQIIQNICLQNCKCSSQICNCYQNSKIELSKIKDKITGPTHVRKLLVQSQNDTFDKSIFRSYFFWFLNQRYLRYLIHQSKTKHKKEYITYKNNVLLYILEKKKRP